MKIRIVRRSVGRVLLNVDGKSIWIEVDAFSSPLDLVVLETFEKFLSGVLSLSE